MDTIRIALGYTPTSTASKATWIMPIIGIDRRAANQRRMNCRRNGTKSSRRSWDTGARSFDLSEFSCRSHLLDGQEAIFGIHHLASTGDLPQSILGIIVTDWRVVAAVKAVSDDAPIFAIKQEFCKAALGCGLDAGQGNSVGISKPIKHVGEFGIFW